MSDITAVIGLFMFCPHKVLELFAISKMHVNRKLRAAGECSAVMARHHLQHF